MGKLYATAKYEERLRQLEEIRAMLSDMADQNGDSRLSRQQITARLEEMIAEQEKKVENLSEQAAALKKAAGWDFSREKAAPVFAADDTLRLRPFSEEDKQFYFAMREQYRSLRLELAEETRIAVDWEAVQPDAAFFCMAERLPDAEALGYIALKNTAKEPWEIAIELDGAHCHQGYGTHAISLFLHRVREITGKREFQFLVESDNLPCQGCMKKAGARLAGLHNLAFDSEADAARFEAAHPDMLTEEMKALAAVIGEPPQRLLSHVLDYRLTLE